MSDPRASQDQSLAYVRHILNSQGSQPHLLHVPQAAGLQPSQHSHVIGAQSSQQQEAIRLQRSLQQLLHAPFAELTAPVAPQPVSLLEQFGGLIHGLARLTERPAAQTPQAPQSPSLQDQTASPSYSYTSAWQTATPVQAHKPTNQYDKHTENK